MAQRSSANVMQFNTRLQATRMMQCRSPDKRSAIRGMVKQGRPLPQI